MGSMLRFDLAETIARYGLEAFVETGTARGDSLAWVARNEGLKHLWSCEIEPLLAAGAICRLNEDTRISIFRMDSALFMDLVTRAALGPTLYWLDAHYPGAGFGLAAYDAGFHPEVALPLGRELACIKAHRAGRDVIVVDDLRIYETGDYEDGPLPDDTPGDPRPGGADWIRAMFAETHEAKTILRDQGYLLLVPKG